MTDDCPPHGIARPSLTELLEQSVDAVHAINTGRPVRCMNCGITFIDGRAGLDHLRQHSMPTRGGAVS